MSEQRIPNPTPRLEKIREGYHPEAVASTVLPLRDRLIAAMSFRLLDLEAQTVTIGTVRALADEILTLIGAEQSKDSPSKCKGCGEQFALPEYCRSCLTANDPRLLAVINRIARHAKLVGIPVDVDLLISATEGHAEQALGEPAEQLYRKVVCGRCGGGRNFDPRVCPACQGHQYVYEPVG